jgi:hypothetical protein
LFAPGKKRAQVISDAQDDTNESVTSRDPMAYSAQQMIFTPEALNASRATCFVSITVGE